MTFDFLQPLDSKFMEFIHKLPVHSLGKIVVFNTDATFPNLEKATIAIIGVSENRGGNSDCKTANLESFRKEFYTLYAGNWNTNIVDLGTIKAGNTIEDTYFLLKNIASYLIKNRIIPVIIGGSQDLTYPLYRAYDSLEQMVNLVVIDSKFDFGGEEKLEYENYLTKIIVNEPNNLFNYTNLGYQLYFNAQEEIDLLNKMYFDTYRLGQISSEPTLAEPVLRDADLVSIDLKAIKSSDSANFTNFSPNGFTGKEICTLARYSGISDKVSSFGVFNQDNSENESVLIAQIVWHFAEGVNYRSNEYPFTSKEKYLKYIVPLEQELIFYKSNLTERWWIEVPFFSYRNNKITKNILFPCSHSDYQAACKGEIPERWWKMQRKNSV